MTFTVYKSVVLQNQMNACPILVRTVGPAWMACTISAVCVQVHTEENDAKVWSIIKWQQLQQDKKKNQHDCHSQSQQAGNQRSQSYLEENKNSRGMRACFHVDVIINSSTRT